jgi:hypothetical protein
LPQRERERVRAFTALERKTRAAGYEEDDTQGDDDAQCDDDTP